MIRLLFMLSICVITTAISAQTRIGSLSIAQGVTSPSDWRLYNNGDTEGADGISVKVNTSSCGFTATPHYIATLEAANGHHWAIIGVTSIYKPTKTGFEVYLRWADHPDEKSKIGAYNNPLTPQTARDLKLVVRWTAIQGAAQCNAPLPAQGTNSSFQKSEVRPFDDGSTDENLKLGFYVVPNPATSTVQLVSEMTFDRFDLLNLNGAVIKTSNMPNFDVAELVPGTYVIRATNDSNGITETKLFVKE